ncbi:hypothetical protein E2C01_096197 [Portunus trituberculatus]|uniref:Uncharacterized protein n=1 Tax=Portunus trituberculatus TaxID=210409 RepID=A0A5B7K256_PORTR|nr:hypothetical protein [Portunus trituberculatus]
MKAADAQVKARVPLITVIIVTIPLIITNLFLSQSLLGVFQLKLSPSIDSPPPPFAPSASLAPRAELAAQRAGQPA